MGWFPCGCCGDGCGIAADEFNRTAGSDLGDDWTEVSGDWEIAAGSIFSPGGVLAPPGADAVAVNTAAHHADASYARAGADVATDTDGDKVRVIVDYVNADNYHFAELEFGSDASTDPGRLSVYIRSGGANTLLNGPTNVAAAIAGSSAVRLEACMIGAMVKGRVGAIGLGAATTPHGGTLAGVGTGATAAGAIEFDSFAFDLHRYPGFYNCQDCGGTVCSGICVDDEAPDLYKVVISGITTNPGVGTRDCTCENLNGTWLVPASATSTCRWQKDLGNQTDCQGWGADPDDRIDMNYGTNGLAERFFEVSLFAPTPFPGTNIHWSEIKLTPEQWDCDSLVDYDVPFARADGGGNPCQPDGGVGVAATCTVTAI